MRKPILAAVVAALALAMVVDTAWAAPTRVETTPGQRNALESARSYLRYEAFSKRGLIAQLRYEHYSKADAKWAANHVHVSWKRQAVKKAREYLRTGSFSRQSLYDQLRYEKFTRAQAHYGVRKAYH